MSVISLLAGAALAAAPLEDPAAAFGARPLLSDLDVSPNGKIYSALIRSGGESGVGVFTVDDGLKFLRFVRDDGNRKIEQAFWKRDDLLVFSARLPGERYGTETVETRLLSTNIETGKIETLFDRAYPKGGGVPQIQSNVVSILKNDPEHIYVQYTPYRSNHNGVFKVNIDKSRRHPMVQAPKDRSIHWMADAKGNIRATLGLANERELRLRIETSEGKWGNFAHRVADGSPEFSVVGFPEEPGKAYVVSGHESDVGGLYLFDADTDRFAEKIFSHPTSEIYGIRQDPISGEVIGVYYAEDSAEVEWLGDSLPLKTVEAIEKVTDYDHLSFQRLNLTGSSAVLFASNGMRPGRYLVFDYATSKLMEMPSQYPSLEGVELGRVFPVTYGARDGLSIPAFVTLPPSFSELGQAQNLPFIVLPHGGPTARDFMGFDWLAQFLAHRGYGVLQMNFRGSSGYGAEFKQAGSRQWGQAMQDDITDGAAWLVEQGLAAPGKMSILGASYGGYAALMGAVKTPDLFRCAVSINGVSDLPKVLSDERDFRGGKYGTRHIGRLWKDRKMLAENSPARRAEDVQVPILLIAGEDDRVVPIGHSERMNKALEREGKDVRFVELEEGSHYLDVGENRIRALREIDSFLEGCR
ncbi:alpha/beta hydrolase family protein [Parvularcula maris]|uniref:Prolyl oligopeptidase family serine peptidase n=1 Tax=Parvularcula maris TaxID=2965077 RepID=A0A9X2RGF9_9PROT|nr:prolyl oligopeptidase family serine peptidase [Parvularcula maris]MCQ8183975.1 prolyl oligopeptidase family serine peptidase [Parvularcula maris]